MDWHRLFGLVLTDFFAGSPFVVELEKDLSAKKQLLDVVIIRKEAKEFNDRLPDGLDNLVAHNLISFKSHQEALDDWTLKELTGHYVNYRKQVSPSMQQLLPEEDFRLYGVCARFPNLLASQTPLEEMQPGVFQCRRGSDDIRIIVLRQLPQLEHNAMLHLFSAVAELVRFGADHFQQRSAETSTLVHRLVVHYQLEGIDMPYTMEDFRREICQEVLEGLTPEQVIKSLPQLVKRLPPEHLPQLLQVLPFDELVKRLPPEQLLQVLPFDELVKRLPPEQLLRMLPRDTILDYLKQTNGDVAPPHSGQDPANP